jgi:ComF family protein
MSLSTFVRTSANAMISALLAPTCAACSAILDTPLDGCVCRNCWTSVSRIKPPVCDICGDPLSPLVDQPVCSHCASHPRVITRTRAIGEYDGTLRELIHALKYQQRHSIANGLAALMRESGRSVLDEADYVVPVPLHRRRERTRGFNQARELARRLGPPLLEPLVRIKHTVPQVELAADQRRANLRGAFRMRKRAFNLKGMRAVLVDDVSTTGATLEACAMVLREAGVEEVLALTAARVVTRNR